MCTYAPQQSEMSNLMIRLVKVLFCFGMSQKTTHPFSIKTVFVNGIANALLSNRPFPIFVGINDLKVSLLFWRWQRRSIHDKRDLQPQLKKNSLQNELNQFIIKIFTSVIM